MRKISREELFEEVWKLPMKELAARYGLSDVGLAKICKRLGVPRPEQGHWARIQHGHEIVRPELPPAPKGELAYFEVEDHVQRRAPRAPTPPPPVIAVAPTLKNPHAIVQQLSKLMHRDFRSDEMHVVRWPGQATLRVTATNKQRAFRILDALCRWLSDHSYLLSIVDDPKDHRFHMLVVEKGGDRFRISLAERQRQSQHVPTTEERERIEQWGTWIARKIDLKPSGQFVLEFLHPDNSYTSYGRWRDSSTKLEQQLGAAALRVPEIFAALAVDKLQTAEAARTARIEAAKRAKEEAQKHHEAELRAARERFDAELKADLRDMVERWEDANRIRHFIQTAEPLLLGGHATDDPNAEARRAWIVWARAYADSLDPTKRPAEIAKRLTPSDPLEHAPHL